MRKKRDGNYIITQKSLRLANKTVRVNYIRLAKANMKSDYLGKMPIIQINSGLSCNIFCFSVYNKNM